MGNGMVAHLSPSTGLRMDSIKAFADGQAINVIHHGGIPLRVLHQRFDQYPKKRYHFIFNNCEHFSEFMESGKQQSPQLRGGMLGASIGYTVTKAVKVQNPWAVAGILIGAGLIGASLAAPKP